MLKWFMHRRIAALEHAFGYDARYMHEMADADLRAATLFGAVMPLTRYCRDLPKDVWYAAKIVAVMAEDCGPCTQLLVKMAEKAGVSSKTLEAVLQRNIDVMPEDLALGFRYAEAVLQHYPEAEILREDILQRWGRRGLISLAFAMTTARLFPTLKYALGHGLACTRVKVGSKEIILERQPA